MAMILRNQSWQIDWPVANLPAFTEYSLLNP